MNGASPTVPALDMTSRGVNLHSGDICEVHMTYNGFTLSMLSMTITGTATKSTFSQSWQIDIPSRVGGTTAYVGFTGASGVATAIQDILSWTYAAPTAITNGAGFTPTGLVFNRNASLQGTSAQLTDGGTGEKWLACGIRGR